MGNYEGCILDLLRDKNKTEAIYKLLKTEGPKAIELLVNILETEESRALKERILLALEKLLPLADFGSIERMLKSQDVFVRNGAIKIFKNSIRLVLPYLKKLAKDSDKNVRKFAIDAISQDDSKEAKAIIKERLTDEEINIVILAIEHLGNLEAKEAAEEIEEILLNTDNLLLQCACLETLAKISFSPHYQSIIQRFSQNVDPIVRFSYLRYIGQFGDESALSVIEKFITENPRIFIKEAVDAIEKIISRYHLKSLPESLKTKLIDIMDTTANSVDKYGIMKILAKTDGEHALNMARDSLNVDNDMVRLSAIEVLGERGSKTDIHLLEDLMKKVKPEELHEAIEDAISRLKKVT